MEKIMNTKLLNTLIDNPFVTSILVADFLVLLLHKPPFMFSAIMLGLLMYLSIYVGKKSVE